MQTHMYVDRGTININLATYTERDIQADTESKTEIYIQGDRDIHIGGRQIHRWPWKS